MDGLRSGLKIASRLVPLLVVVGVCSEASFADSWKFEDWEYNYTQETEYVLWIYKVENSVTTKVTELDYDYIGPVGDPYTYYMWHVEQTVIMPGNQETAYGVIRYRVNGGPWYTGGQVQGVRQ